MKACAKCKLVKELDAFPFDRKRQFPSRHSYCKACQCAYSKARNASIASYEATQRRLWFKRYNLTPEAMEALWQTQEGCCAICHKPLTRERGAANFHIDHDHVTGRVRSLLCNSDNVALGLLKEDPKRIRALADYIESHRRI